MKGEALETVSHHPYLGVELSDNLKSNNHINSITKKSFTYPWIFEKEPEILSTKSEREILLQLSKTKIRICFTHLESI